MATSDSWARSKGQCIVGILALRKVEGGGTSGNESNAGHRDKLWNQLNRKSIEDRI